MSDSTGRGRHRTVRRALPSLLAYGVGVPAVIVGALYAASGASGVAFGNLVFGATLLAALAFVPLAGWGRRTDAARPESELLRGSASAYGREVARGTFVRLPTPARLLAVLVGTVALGWLALLAVG